MRPLSLLLLIGPAISLSQRAGWWQRVFSTPASLEEPVHLIAEEAPTRPKPKVLRFVDPDTELVYQALGSKRRQFTAFLEYQGVQSPDEDAMEETEGPPDLSLWSQARLLADRTEWLSRKDGSGAFADLLDLYTERWLALLSEDDDRPRAWLGQHCPCYEAVAPSKLGTQSLEQQKQGWQVFLDWFRHEFPYFYDRCEHCGATGNKDDESPFVGYLTPTAAEKEGKATRTELYQCQECHRYTRFPRYNSLSYVLEHRRGRCGEYSMVLVRFLRALGHESRWVIDWADHVWAEVKVGEQWIHLDPCEAAVDHNYLYQGWGKKQTYILAFYAPLSGSAPLKDVPWVEDVTHLYTSDQKDEIFQRRDDSEDDVRQAMEKALQKLEERLKR